MTEVASAFVSILPSFKGFGSKIAAEGGAESGAAGGLLGGILGKAMLSGFAAVGVAAAIGVSLYKIGSEFDDSVTKPIRVGTGATGKALEGLQHTAEQLGKTVPVSLSQIGPVVATLNSRLGLTGKPLKQLASQFLDLGHILNEEIDPTTVTKALSSFNVKSGQTSHVMDQLFRVTESTGIKFDDLTSILTRQGPILSQFGFGIKESASLIGTLDKAGLDSNRTLGTMAHALATFAKAGQDPQKAFKDTIAQMQAFIKKGDEAGAVNLAAKVFGTRGAAQFVAAVKSGKVNMQSLTDATKGNHDTIKKATDDTSHFSEQWQLFKNRVIIGLEPIATKAFESIGKLSEKLGPIVRRSIARIAPEIQKLATAAQPFIATVQRNLIPVLTQLGNTYATKILPAALRLGQFLATTFGPVLVSIGRFIATSVLPILSQLAVFLYGKVYPAVLSIATSVAHSLAPSFKQLANTITTQILPALKPMLAAFLRALPTIEKVALVILKISGFTIKAGAAILGRLLPPFIKLIGFMIGTAIKAQVWFVTAVVNVIKKVIEFGGVLVGAVKSAAKFATGVIDKAGQVLGWFKKLPDKITGFLKGLPGQLLSLGKAIVSGLAHGISSAAHWVYDAVKSIIDKIPKAIRKIMHISSPSKVTQELGAFITEGLAQGIISKGDKVDKAVKALVGSVKSHLTDIKDSFSQLADPIAQAFTGNLFDATSASGFIASLTSTKGTLTNLLAAFKTLLGWGLSPGFLSQLFNSGNSSLILSLAAAGKDAATQAGSLFSDVTGLSNQLGTNVAGATDQGAALLKEQQKQTHLLAAIEKHQKQFAHDVAEAINKGAGKARRNARAA